MKGNFDLDVMQFGK